MNITELVPTIESQKSETFKVTLRDVEYANRMLKVGDRELELSDEGLGAFGNHLGIPRSFLPKLPDELANETANYFLKKNDTAEAFFETHSGSLFAVYPSNEKIFPKIDIARSLVRGVNDDNAMVKDLNLQGPGIKVSITTNQYTTEPREGDITEGGIRVVGFTRESGPVVSSFLNRLVCSNGMIIPEEQGRIKIRGNTVEEVMEEVEYAARHLLSESIPQHLESWSNTTKTTVDNAEQMIHRLARENQLSASVQDAILEQVPSLEGDSLYDLVNLMTSFQHEDIRASQAERLMYLGGNVVGSGLSHRCTSCAHVLD